MVHIVIIDDEMAIRHLLRSLFERHAYQVMEAANGTEGLQMCRDTCPDLVVTDLEMPGRDMPGVAFIQALHQACPTAHVMAMSGNPDALTSVRALTEYTLAKPFRLQHVLAIVQALVGAPAPVSSFLHPQEVQDVATCMSPVW